MKLGIYCRISRIKDGNDLSIEDQKQKGIDKATALELPYEIYVDEGLSGASEKIEDRPEFQRFIGDVSNGVLTHVFAYDQSRFERNPQIRFIINELFKKHKVTYLTQMDGIVDLHDPQAEFFGDLLSVINKFHVTTTKIKVKSVLKNRVKEGKTRGILPYGYTKNENDMMIVDEEEAKIVKRIYKMSLDGIGTKTIADTFNQEEIPTRYNKISKGTLSTKNKYTGKITTTDKKDINWSPNTVMNILRNTVYKGERNYSGEVVSVPAIFEPVYWDRVNYNIPLNKNNAGKKAEYRYLLKGLIRCGVCGRNMYGKKRLDKHDNHYMCSSKRIKGANCGNRSINIDKIEYLVWFTLFSDSKLAEKIEQEFHIDKDEIKRFKDQISKNESSMSTLQNDRKRAIDLVIKGIISEDDISANLKDIDAKIEEKKIINNEVQQKIFAFENSTKIINKYKSKFSEFTNITNFEQKRKIINDFVHNIIVNYDKELNEYKIEFDFKIDVYPSFINSSLSTTDSSFQYFSNKESLDNKAYDYLSTVPPTELIELYNDGADSKEFFEGDEDLKDKLKDYLAITWTKEEIELLQEKLAEEKTKKTEVKKESKNKKIDGNIGTPTESGVAKENKLKAIKAILKSIPKNAPILLTALPMWLW